MSKPIRVILADDHSLVLEGLTGLIEQMPDIEVIATAHNGDEVLNMLDKYQVDVLVLDLQMSYGGLQVLQVMHERQINVHVLVLTAFSDGATIQSAIGLGAEGFALKTESPTQTIEAIRQVAQGRLVFPHSAQKWLFNRDASVPSSTTLSAREREVIAQLAHGLTNPEIAQALRISENTVRFHLKNIFEKLKVTNRTEAAAWYFTDNNNNANPLF